MAWENEAQNNLLKIKEGNEYIFKILSITEAEPTAKIKPLKDRNFWYRIETDKGIVIGNNQGLVQSLSAVARVGDTVRVKYIKKGQIGSVSIFEVEVLEKAEQPF